MRRMKVWMYLQVRCKPADLDVFLLKIRKCSNIVNRECALFHYSTNIEAKIPRLMVLSHQVMVFFTDCVIEWYKKIIPRREAGDIMVRLTR